MDKEIPKHIIEKLIKCNEYHNKSNKIMFEVLDWFEKHGCDIYGKEGEFQTVINDIQFCGFEKNDIEKLKEYLM